VNRKKQQGWWTNPFPWKISKMNFLEIHADKEYEIVRTDLFGGGKKKKLRRRQKKEMPWKKN